MAGLDAAIAFFHRTRSELRILRMVRVSTNWVRLYDVNGDYFELRGLGYPDRGHRSCAQIVRYAVQPRDDPCAVRGRVQGI